MSGRAKALPYDHRPDARLNRQSVRNLGPDRCDDRRDVLGGVGRALSPGRPCDAAGPTQHEQGPHRGRASVDCSGGGLVGVRQSALVDVMGQARAHGAERGDRDRHW